MWCKCETIDVLCAATSEIVIEGVLLPAVRRTEGPFGEFPGYYQAVTEQPVFKLKAITHRRNPIYVTALTGPPTTDNHVMSEIVLGSDALRPASANLSDDAGCLCHQRRRQFACGGFDKTDVYQSSARRHARLLFHRANPSEARRGR